MLIIYAEFNQTHLLCTIEKFMKKKLKMNVKIFHAKIISKTESITKMTMKLTLRIEGN
jgi:hypothetical protein